MEVFVVIGFLVVVLFHLQDSPVVVHTYLTLSICSFFFDDTVFFITMSTLEMDTWVFKFAFTETTFVSLEGFGSGFQLDILFMTTFLLFQVLINNLFTFTNISQQSLRLLQEILLDISILDFLGNRSGMVFVHFLDDIEDH